MAGINIERHKTAARVRLLQSDLYEKLAGNRYDLIVANPPYVGTGELAGLPQEYTHEPVRALDGGRDGLAVVRRILRQSGRYLKDNGILVVEVGEARDVLAGSFPQLPFIWLEFERGGEGVFLLTAGDLQVYG